MNDYMFIEWYNVDKTEECKEFERNSGKAMVMFFVRDL
jgi:hypothetical protein